MSEAVEPVSVQGESDVESILSGSEENLSEIDDDTKSQSKSPISEIEEENTDDDDDDDDDDEDVDSEMLRKLEKDEYSDILIDYHPENHGVLNRQRLFRI